MSKTLQLRLLAMICAVLLLGSGLPGRADTAPCKDGRLSAGQPFSASGFGRQLGRGLLNIGFCWLEMPYQIKTYLEHNADVPDIPLLPVFNLVCGVSVGSFRTVERATSGVIEVVFSPWPGYGPLLCPPDPPYLFIKPEPTAPAPEETEKMSNGNEAEDKTPAVETAPQPAEESPSADTGHSATDTGQ